jgi:thioesterase DpgC
MLNLENTADSLWLKFKEWELSSPAFQSSLEMDTESLQSHVVEGESILAELPERRLRTEPQQTIAAAVHRVSRHARAIFMEKHAKFVYDAVMASTAEISGLSDISFTASELFPGLTPTRRQVASECEKEQASKEGREIDLGIFFHALLSVPDIGMRIINNMLKPTAKALQLLPEFVRSADLKIGAVHLQRRGRAAYLTFENASCLNAEDNELIDSMETAVDLALLDDAVGVLILRGGEMQHPRYKGRRVFSAGINLNKLHAGSISYTDFLLRREFGYINKMACGLVLDATEGNRSATRREKPCIAAVDTFAIGGGAQILLVCDHVIAGAGSYFSLPAAQEGIIPGVANLRLGDMTGARLARQIILSGRQIWANEEAAKCIFDEVVAPAAMEQTIAMRADQLDNPAVIANRRMLRLAREPEDRFRTYMAEFALAQALRMYSQDVLNKVARA